MCDSVQFRGVVCVSFQAIYLAPPPHGRFCRLLKTLGFSVDGLAPTVLAIVLLGLKHHSLHFPFLFPVYREMGGLLAGCCVRVCVFIIAFSFPYLFARLRAYSHTCSLVFFEAAYM